MNVIKGKSFNLIILFLANFAAQPLFPQNDHPLLTRYPGSTIEKHEVKEFDSYKLVTGYDGKGNELLGKAVEGKMTRIVYQNPQQRSTLEIFRNYETALTSAGTEILYKCAGEECGPTYSTSYWNRFNGIMAFTGKDSHYLAGKLQTANAEAYIAVMVGKQRTQVDIVESKAMDTGMVAVNAEALAAGLARDGKVSIYGIYFDTGKAAVKPESKPTLDEIAKLLQQQPALKIFVVGHTDNAGTLVLNLQLAKDRAASVVQALVADYQIAAARLDPHGVGPLAPAATNATEDGRAKNRRVELVAQ